MWMGIRSSSSFVGFIKLNGPLIGEGITLEIGGWVSKILLY